MSLNTTIGLNPLTNTTLTNNTSDSTQNSVFTTIVYNSTTIFNTTTTRIYPNGDFNITWVIPTLPPTIYIPPPTVVDTGNYYSISLYSYIIVLAIIIVATLVAKVKWQNPLISFTTIICIPSWLCNVARH